MSAAANVKLRAVALPAEHGGWGFLLEPILLGLLLAPSLGGLWLALSIFGMFLTRHPLKLAITDFRRGRRFTRTTLAERFVRLYTGLAALGLLLAVLTAGPAMLLPMAFAFPLMLVQLYYDFSNRSRSVLPELAGPIALASVASSMALAGGWLLPDALALWLIGAGRSVPSVLYVRARLRLEKGGPASPMPALLSHILTLVVIAALIAAQLAPLLALLPFVVLLARAALGLSSRRVSVPARIIGFREMAYGGLTVLLVVLGYRSGL